MGEKKRARNFRELNVYTKAFKAAITIYNRSKSFPVEEKYSLTDQIRRSSRSVCANIAEAWKKRIYPAAFVSKLSDSEAECAETQVWLQFALAHEYIDEVTFSEIDETYEHVGAMLITMSQNKEKWTI